MWFSVFSISSGAVLGALLRWQLGARLNALFPYLPPGTLTANLLGGYLACLAVAIFAAMPQLSPEWKLFVITGFLGALTTFSSFSLEMVSLMQQERYAWALAGITSHLFGPLLMTLAGIGTVQLVRHLLAA